MITRRLWLAYRYPAANHPLYEQVVKTHPEQVPWYLWLVAVVLSPVFVLFLIVLTTLALAIPWTVSISRAISHEKLKRRYDVLRTSLGGELLINWLICAACMHRGQSFVRLHSLGFWATRLLIAVLLILSSGLVLRAETTPEIVATLAMLAAVGLVLIIDHYQTIVIAGLSSITVSTYLTDSFALSILAPGILVMIQLVTYLLAALVSFGFLPRIIGVDALLILYALHVVAFALIRELGIFALWRWMLFRLHTNPREATNLLDWHSSPLI